MPHATIRTLAALHAGIPIKGVLVHVTLAYLSQLQCCYNLTVALFSRNFFVTPVAAQTEGGQMNVFLTTLTVHGEHRALQHYVPMEVVTTWAYFNAHSSYIVAMFFPVPSDARPYVRIHPCPHLTSDFPFSLTRSLVDPFWANAMYIFYIICISVLCTAGDTT